jgi:hypothetical protein
MDVRNSSLHARLSNGRWQPGTDVKLFCFDGFSPILINEIFQTVVAWGLVWRGRANQESLWGLLLQGTACSFRMLPAEVVDVRERRVF